MKTSLKCLALAAVAAVALVSCKQETVVPDQPGNVHITVKAVPQDFANEDTRTYIDETNTIIWGTGEYMKIAVKGGNTVFGDSSEDCADIFDGEDKAMFEFDITPDAADTYTYMGLYPSSAAVASNNDNAANYKVKLPSIQNATASSYDPAAYIMVARPDPFDELQDLWEAWFRRATALNKVTLTNLNDDIIQVDFIAGEGVNLAGSAHINLTTGEDVDIYSGENAVSVKYATALPASADKVVWFTSWDSEIAEGEKLTIVAKSATKSYTRELTARSAGILFKEGYLNTLKVNMSNAEVENISSLEGNFVILAKKTSDPIAYYAMKGEATTGSTKRIVSVDYTGSLESYSDGNSDIVWTITASGPSYTIKNGNNYLGWTSGNAADLIAEADYNADKCLMSIDDNGDGTYKIYVTAATTRILARNTSNAYFAFYENTQYKDLILVPVIEDDTPRIEVDPVAIESVSYKGGDFSDLRYELKNMTGEIAEITCDETIVTEAVDIYGTVLFTVSPNDSEDERDGWIKIAAGGLEVEVPVRQAGRPSSEIVLDGITDGKIFIGPNEGDEATFIVHSNYAWYLVSEYFDGFDETFYQDPTEGNPDDVESDDTTVTVEAWEANEGTVDRLLGTIIIYDVQDDSELASIEVWQRATHYDFTTVAELNTLIANNEPSQEEPITYSGKLTDVVVSYVPNAKNAIIKDETGSILVYKDNHGLLQGQTFSGDLTVTTVLYNHCSEITAIEATFTGNQATVLPEVVTLADLVGNLNTYQNAYVQVTGLEVTAVSGKNVTVKDNENNSYVVYSSAGNAECVVGDIITVVGTIAWYNDNDQIKAWTTGDITVTYHPAASHTITFAQPTGAAADAGCFFTVSVGGNPITSGASIEEETTVTLTAVEGTGYTFRSWTVSGATVSGNTNPATFVVGTSDVTISASFEDNSSTSVIDILNPTAFGNPSSYSNWSGKTGTSGAVYAGNSSGGNSYFQIRSNNNNSGIVTTTSGGYARKVTITWDSSTENARVLQVYGKHTSYSAATDLYDNSKQGTLLGTIAKNGGTELTISGDYEYIGLRSASGAMYITEIRIEWSTSGGGTPPAPETYSVSWTTPSQTGCTISATVDSSPISSGDEFEEGTVVTITATAGSGFTFGGWTLTGATPANASSVTTTFDIGTSDLTISATFNVDGGDALVYTLEPASGSNNTYNGNCDIPIDGITWNITGNSQYIPWRLGGKSITGIDRAIYSKTALNYDVSKIVVTHGNASGITVNSMTVIVASDATFNTVVSTLTPTFEANKTVTISRPSGAEWKNCYYKFVYNVTVSGSSNKFLEFTRAEFTGK